MDSYLEIAESILRAARRPLTAKAILDAAYRVGVVPEHLYGKTQEKTLQARLSEDILHQKNLSRFFRTEPGYFFLAELESDPSVPEKYKKHFSAKRRIRDLYPRQALAIDANFAALMQSNSIQDWQTLVANATGAGAIKYVNPKLNNGDFLPVWAFSVVKKRHSILTHRIGRYRDDRDAFMNKRTIGFSGMVSVNDQTLFSGDDWGMRECALNIVLHDLDVSIHALGGFGKIDAPQVSFAIFVSGPKRRNDILVITEWVCPDWYEPTNRRLSLNNLAWMDAAQKPNDMDDFEPWSIAVLNATQSSQKAEERSVV